MPCLLLACTLSWAGSAAAAAGQATANESRPESESLAAAAWSRAMDALVANDLLAASNALAEVASNAGTSEARRAEARDLIDRIRRRRTTAAASAVTGAAPASAATTATATATATVPPAGAAAAGQPTPTTPDAPAAPARSAPDLDDSTEASTDGDRGGRVFLLGATTFAGLALWGWTLPSMFGIENNRGLIGLYMLTAGASFGVPFLLTRHGPATWGMANMTWLGASRGALAGLAVHGLIAGNSGSDAGLSAGLFVGSVLGAASGALFARSTDLTPGAAHVTSIGGDVGALTGLAIAHLSGLDQLDKDDATRDADAGVRAMAGFALAGGALGLLGGRVLAQRGDYTWGDAEVMRLPIGIGVTGAAMIMDWSNTDSSRAIVGVLAAGGLTGAVVGATLVQNKDYGVGQGFLVDLGTVAGALVAMGSVYLASGSSRSETYLTSGFVGAAGAFAVMVLTLDAPALRKLSMRLTPDGESASRFSLLPTLGAHSARGLAVAGSF